MPEPDAVSLFFLWILKMQKKNSNEPDTDVSEVDYGSFEISDDAKAKAIGLLLIDFDASFQKTKTPCISLWFNKGALTEERMSEIAACICPLIPASRAQHMYTAERDVIALTPIGDCITLNAARNTFIGLVATHCIEGQTMSKAACLFGFADSNGVARPLGLGFDLRKKPLILS